MELLKSGHTIIIIGVYLPSEDADEQTKDTFCNALADTITNIEGDKEIYILGDSNGRVGEEEHNHIVKKYGETTKNENDLCLRKFFHNMSL